MCPPSRLLLITCRVCVYSTTVMAVRLGTCCHRRYATLMPRSAALSQTTRPPRSCAAVVHSRRDRYEQEASSTSRLDYNAVVVLNDKDKRQTRRHRTRLRRLLARVPAISVCPMRHRLSSRKEMEKGKFMQVCCLSVSSLLDICCQVQDRKI